MFESFQLNDIKHIFSMRNAIFLYFFFKVSIIILNSAYFVMTLNLKKKNTSYFLSDCRIRSDRKRMDGFSSATFLFFCLIFVFFCWVWLIMYSIHYIISIFMSAFLQPFCLNSKLFLIQCAVWLVESEKKFYFPIFNMN